MDLMLGRVVREWAMQRPNDWLDQLSSVSDRTGGDWSIEQRRDGQPLGPSLVVDWLYRAGKHDQLVAGELFVVIT